MRRYIFVIASVVALLLASGFAKSASAQGFHFRSGGVHVDFGNPHVRYFNSPYTSYWGGGWPVHSLWHDTTHLDYHPGSYVRHRNHLHFVPGHYDVHHGSHRHRHF